jgi:integrase
MDDKTTDLEIRALRPKEGVYRVAFGGGLYLEVRPDGPAGGGEPKGRAPGGKWWRLRYAKADGKRSFVSLGAYPKVGLKEARRKARELGAAARRGELGRGGKAGAGGAMTFARLAEDWEQNNPRETSERDAKRKGDYLRRFILPQIGGLDVDTVPPSLILDAIIRPIEREGHFETAHKVKALISLIYDFGIASGKVKSGLNPARGLAKAMKTQERKHLATITDPAEVGRLLAAIHAYEGHPSVSYALRILPYVFVRPGELRGATWAEFDLEAGLWRIPAGRMKGRAAHTVPLADQVVGLLWELRGITGGEGLLFPGIRGNGRPISDMALTAALRYMGFPKDKICPHGFRAMASTLLNGKASVKPDWVEMQLSHREKNLVRAAYNHADYLPERRKMMQEYADYLDSLRAGALAGA